jgi:Cupin-like domain
MIQRLINPTREAFYETAILPAQPAFICGAMKDWPCHHWNDSSLAEKLADRRFRVNQTKTGKFGIYSMRSRPGETMRQLTFQELLQSIEQEPGMVHYMEQVPLNASCGSLWDDVRYFDCVEASLAESVNLWYSQKDSRIPLHWDSRDNILAQVKGHKSVVLYAPDQTDNLYPGLDGAQWASQVDMDEPDPQKHPAFAQARVAAKFVLNEGEALYLPRHWWHHIITLSDRAVSINYWYDKSMPAIRPVRRDDVAGTVTS